MDSDFHLLDLVSQALALQRLLKGRTSREKLEWLAAHGEVVLFSAGPPRAVYQFTSLIGFDRHFSIDGDVFVFYGGHTACTVHE